MPSFQKEDWNPVHIFLSNMWLFCYFHHQDVMQCNISISIRVVYFCYSVFGVGYSAPLAGINYFHLSVNLILDSQFIYFKYQKLLAVKLVTFWKYWCFFFLTKKYVSSSSRYIVWRSIVLVKVQIFVVIWLICFGFGDSCLGWDVVAIPPI